MLYSVVDPTGSKLDIVQLRAGKSANEVGRKYDCRTCNASWKELLNLSSFAR